MGSLAVNGSKDRPRKVPRVTGADGLFNGATYHGRKGYRGSAKGRRLAGACRGLQGSTATHQRPPESRPKKPRVRSKLVTESWTNGPERTRTSINDTPVELDWIGDDTERIRGREDDQRFRGHRLENGEWSRAIDHGSSQPGVETDFVTSRTALYSVGDYPYIGS